MNLGGKQLADYRGIVTDECLDSIRSRAAELRGATVVHVNATSFGGGVAEILGNLVPLMNDVGIRTDWRVLHGTPAFFEVTKKMHNALQGQALPFPEQDLKLYETINHNFAQFAFLDHDFVIVHDPQPCALVGDVRHTSPWVWRCHIDITHSNAQAWQFLEPFILQYERMIVSAAVFQHSDTGIEQQIISPSIDPLSPKNLALTESNASGLLELHGIPTDKPLVTQVSRFDPWKDPEGVLSVFERVRPHADCRFVFCYNLANDDPEGTLILERMLKAAKPHLASADVLFVRGDDPELVNVLQTASAVVLQKSIREGFGLTVTEAMWKGTPVVATNVGGIPTQIEDGVTGYLVGPNDLDGCAERIVRLLADPDLAAEIGCRARESVRERFLITRHLLDYLDLLLGL